MIFHRFLFNSPVGSLTITTIPNGLVSLDFHDNSREIPNNSLPISSHESPLTTHRPFERVAISWLEAYFSRKFSKMEIPIFFPPETTSFQLKIYKELLKTAPGDKITYGELASRAGYKGAARAVGNAMAKNPLPIFIPCHRVISSSGLGGYTPGIEIKKMLLNLEGTPYSS